MRYHHNSTDWIANPLKAKAAESDLKEPKYFHLFFSFEIIAIIYKPRPRPKYRNLGENVSMLKIIIITRVI